MERARISLGGPHTAGCPFPGGETALGTALRPFKRPEALRTGRGNPPLPVPGGENLKKGLTLGKALV